MPRQRDLPSLLRDVGWALRHGLEDTQLRPMLAQLAAVAPRGTDSWELAIIKLAELEAPTHPWRASILARQALREGDTPHAWAVFALAQSLLGNFRIAARCYRRALFAVPDNPWYAHNLGHLLDVAFNRPNDALPYLKRAYEAQPAEPEIAASLAHAMLASGDPASARRLLARSFTDRTEVERLLARWTRSPAPATPEPLSEWSADSGRGRPATR